MMCKKDTVTSNIDGNEPNAETIAAIKEVEEIKKNPDVYKSYGSFSELLKELISDAEKSLKELKTKY